MNKKTNISPLAILQNLAGQSLGILLLAVCLMLTACASEDYIGEEENLNGPAIAFNTGTGSASTRASRTGADAASVLGNKFFVFGSKKDASDNKQVVFPGYEVSYEAGTAYSTTSNSANWEYVGKGDDTQYIKYWDFGAAEYDFAGYSFGVGDADGNKATVADGASLDNYSLIGTSDQLKACYITDLLAKGPAEFTNHQVTLSFFPLAAKARIGVYETIPGYSIKEIKFYSADATQSDAPALYTAGTLPDGGTYIVSYDDDDNHLQLAYSATGTGAATKTVQVFPAITLDAEREYREGTDNIYMGRTSAAANMSDYATVLPNVAGAALTMKVDYTLLSKDGTGETIKVKGATACVPAAFTQWKPNYSYTYLFKISDNTNGSTGQVEGLYPITLDAVSVDGEQQTVTTVTSLSDYYITTYQKNSDVAPGCEYNAGKIYAVIGDGSSEFDTSKATIYEASITGDDGSYITEAAVENDLQNGTYDATAKTYTLTDYTQTVDINTYKATLVLTDKGNSQLTAITTIPAEHTVDGIARDVNGAYFTAETGKTYVLMYLMTEGSATAATAYSSGTVYYKKNPSGYYYIVSVADADAFAAETETLYTNPTQPVYACKVIKIKE